jgi:hypothetical protein
MSRRRKALSSIFQANGYISEILLILAVPVGRSQRMTSSIEELKGSSFRSISLSNLSRLLGKYPEVREGNGKMWSRRLAKHFKDNGIWPPLHESVFFAKSAPDVVLTYMWCGTDVSEIVHLLTIRFGSQKTVWIDVFFNDQRTPEMIQNAVKSANSIYRDAPDHAIIMSVGDYDGVLCLPWDRCWIVNELAIRDVVSVKEYKKRPPIIIFGMD